MRQISKKAYEGFNRQLNNAFKVVPNCYCNGVGIVLSMIDLYLAEKDVRLEQRTMEVKLAYMMLLPELEKAVARSARARENAARRRKKKLAELNTKKAEDEQPKKAENNPKPDGQTMKKQSKSSEKSDKKSVNSPLVSSTDGALHSVSLIPQKEIGNSQSHPGQPYGHFL